MSVIAAKLVAVFIACGSYAEPGTVAPGPFVCSAHVFPPITMTDAECVTSAAAEGASAQQNLIKGGFTNTTYESGCFDAGHSFTNDDALTSYMNGKYNPAASQVQRYKFNGQGFELIAPANRQRF